MNLQPILENDLIKISPLVESDFDQLYTVASDPLIWKQHPKWDRYKKHVFEKFFIDAMQSNGALKIIERSNEKIIGSSRFKIIEQSADAIEIGWSFLSRDKWGGTYNAAMKHLMIDYALQNVDSVIFYIDINNMRSQKAVQKIGGRLIVNPKWKHLIRENTSYLTYRIGNE